MRPSQADKSSRRARAVKTDDGGASRRALRKEERDGESAGSAAEPRDTVPRTAPTYGAPGTSRNTAPPPPLRRRRRRRSLVVTLSSPTRSAVPLVGHERRWPTR